jgi:hypothetical protein
MKDQGKQKRSRLVQESRGQAQDEAMVERQVRTWKRRAAFLGLALMVSTGLVILFLAGHSLHRHFRDVGKALVVTSMCLLGAFMYSAGTAYNLWAYHRALRRAYGDSDGTRPGT